VTQKIVHAACRIAADGKGKLKLGNLAVERDWGWAPEFVDAMHRMLQQPAAGDYVIATGECHPLGRFVERAFACVGLDWRECVETDPALLRPTDLRRGWGNPAKAARELDWTPKVRMDEVVERMVAACQRRGGV
jgi:GDPmannose 4,6-dehydratase